MTYNQSFNNQNNYYYNTLKKYFTELRYGYLQKAMDDSLKLLNNLGTLSPVVANFKLDNQPADKLVCLEGTIPMYYRSRKYNVPVKIFLAKLHPVQAPVCYVCPTQGMIVKPNHRNVNQSDGRVYIQYLSNWNYNTSSLYDLVNTLSTIFGQDPPVFKAPKTPSSGGGNRYSSGGQRGYHSRGGGSMGSSMGSMGGMGSSMGSMGGGSLRGTMGTSSSGTGTMGGGSGGSLRGTMGSGGGYSMYNVNSNIYKQQQQARFQGPTEEEKLAAKKAELTSRILKKLKPLVERRKKELNQETVDLNKQKLKLKKQELQERQINQSLENCGGQIKHCQGVIEKSQKYIAKYSKDIDVDKVINIKDTHQRQVLEKKAMSEVYGDLMYVLDQAVIRGNLNLDVWKKSMIKYSRKQFMKKALIRKIEEGKKF